MLNHAEHINKSKENLIATITKIIVQDKISLFQLREQLYTFLTLNYRIHDCFSTIIFKLIEIKYIQEDNIHLVLKTYNKFTEKYNNNYRPIYHLESFILFLINLKNKQENIMDISDDDIKAAVYSFLSSGRQILLSF